MAKRLNNPTRPREPRKRNVAVKFCEEAAEIRNMTVKVREKLLRTALAAIVPRAASSPTFVQCRGNFWGTNVNAPQISLVLRPGTAFCWTAPSRTE